MRLPYGPASNIESPESCSATVVAAGVDAGVVAAGAAGVTGGLAIGVAG